MHLSKRRIRILYFEIPFCKFIKHILARLKGVKFDDIEKILKADAAKHAEKGLYLQHLWQNIDNPNEVVFLFKTDDIARAKRFIQGEHENALKINANANLPVMIFLE
jgi:hypothetical protein